MGKQFQSLSEEHIAFIQKQKIFFVGTAASGGRVNISPKGFDSFRVLGPSRVAWLNVTGSGNETSAHVQINPRMTLMFCSFEGAPLILRIYGRARVLHSSDPGWNELAKNFHLIPGARQLFDVEVEMVQTSCGMGVPYFGYEAERDSLVKWADQKGPEGLQDYWREKNMRSIDGYPTNLIKDRNSSE